MKKYNLENEFNRAFKSLMSDDFPCECYKQTFNKIAKTEKRYNMKNGNAYIHISRHKTISKIIHIAFVTWKMLENCR